MRRAVIAFHLVATLLTLSSKGQELDLTTQDILAQDKLTLQAMLHKDMAYLDKHIAPDAVFKSMGKQLTKRMFLAQVMEQPEAPGQVRERFSKVSSQTSGDVVAVTATVTLAVLNGGSWIDFYEIRGSTRYKKVDGEWVTLGADNEYEKPVAHAPLVSNNRPAPEPSAPAPPPPTPAQPCAGIELMGLYKNEIFDRQMGGGVVEWLAKIRNNTSSMRIVVFGWIDQYGQEQRSQVQIRGGDIASPRVDMTQSRLIAPVRDLKLVSCE